MKWQKVKKKYKFGDKIKGTITSIAYHGIYLSTEDNVKVFVRRSECLPTQKIVDLTKRFRLNEEKNVMVLKLCDEFQDIEASFKAVLPDPWKSLSDEYQIGAIVKGEIINIKEKIAEVELEPGILGIILLSLLGMKVDNMSEVFLRGDKVKAKIIDIKHNERRLILSIAHLLEDEFTTKEKETLFTLGDLIKNDIKVTLHHLSKKLDSSCKLKNEVNQKYKNAVIIAPNNSLRESLSQILRQIGINSRVIENINLITNKYIENESSLYFVSLSLIKSHDQFSSLLKRITGNNTHIIIEGKNDQLNTFVSEIERYNLQNNILKIPYSTRDIVFLLNTSLKASTPENILRTSQEEISFIDGFLNGEKKFVHQDLLFKNVLQIIKEQVKASSIFLFKMHLSTYEIEIFVSSGFEKRLTDKEIDHLIFSPIKDVILGNFLWYDPVGKTKDHQIYLRCLGLYESVLGKKIDYEDEYGYSLFLFGERKNQFIENVENYIELASITLRAMLERNRFEIGSKAQHKFIVSGKLSSGLVHELENLQAASNLIDVLKIKSIKLNRGEIQTNDKEFLVDFEKITDDLVELQKKSRTIQNIFLNILRREFESRTDIKKHLESICNTLEPVAQNKNVLLSNSLEDVPYTYINLGYLDQIMFNLFTNSLEHIPLIRKKTGRINIELQYDKNKKKPIIIKFSDNGPGIHEKHKERVFDLIFSTRPSGTGLGLYISRTLVETMDGNIFIGDNHRMSGVTFILEFPLKEKKENG